MLFDPFDNDSILYYFLFCSEVIKPVNLEALTQELQICKNNDNVLEQIKSEEWNCHQQPVSQISTILQRTETEQR